MWRLTHGGGLARPANDNDLDPAVDSRRDLARRRDELLQLGHHQVAGFGRVASTVIVTPGAYGNRPALAGSFATPCFSAASTMTTTLRQRRARASPGYPL